MAKISFGEYSAFTTKNNMVRYQKNNKLVSEKVLPPEVVAYLNNKLAETTKFPMPTEEEKARLREESLKVKPELQREDTTPAEAPLTSEDFEPDGSFNPEPTDEVIEAVASQIPPQLGIVSDTPDPSVVDPDFLEQVSIHTASIQDIAEALYTRFGIYTVYLGKLPENGDYNPLTAEAFTKYHMGIAYQAAIYAKNKGILNRPAEEGRKMIDQSRAAHENFSTDPVPQTMGDARRANSFDYRTSVEGTRTQPTTEIRHERGEDGQVRAVQVEIPAGQTGEFNGAAARFSADDDQLLVEPRFGKQVIRPNW